MVKEVDLYSSFIVVPHTQGAQVRITRCYLQITPYLPLPRKHSPDGASPEQNNVRITLDSELYRRKPVLTYAISGNRRWWRR